MEDEREAMEMYRREMSADRQHSSALSARAVVKQDDGKRVSEAFGRDRGEGSVALSL